MKDKSHIVQAGGKLASLYSLDALSWSLETNEWDIEEEMSRLVNIAKHGEVKDQMAAMKQLRAIQREILTFNGLISRGTEVRESKKDDGSTVRQEVTSTMLVDFLKQRNENARNNSGRTLPVRYPASSTGSDPLPPPSVPEPLEPLEARVVQPEKPLAESAALLDPEQGPLPSR